MGAMLYDTACRQLLLVSSERLEEFEALAEAMYGPLDWKEDDGRIREGGDGVFSVDPIGEDGFSFFSGPRSHFYDDDIALLLTLCEPGSVVDVLDGETGFFQRFAIQENGDLARAQKRLANPFETSRTTV